MLVVCSISRIERTPIRTTEGLVPVRSNTVDGASFSIGPPSKTNSNLSPIMVETWLALRRLDLLERLALVPIILPPIAAASALGIGWFGTLTATFLELPVISLLRCLFAGNMSVKAPGQKCADILWAISENSETIVSTVRILSNNSGNPLELDRPFTVNNLSIASSELGLAPSPYKVSVGYAITPPLRSTMTASLILSDICGENRLCCKVYPTSYSLTEYAL